MPPNFTPRLAATGNAANRPSALSNARSLAASIHFQVVFPPLFEQKFENMKFAIEIRMTAEVEVKNITSATVIRHLHQYTKSKGVLMDEIMDDRHFEVGARNQRFLDQLKSDRALLLRYAKLVALLEAFMELERTREKDQIQIEDEMEKIEKSVVKRLGREDARWFRGAIKHEAWAESTEHLNEVFHVTVSTPRVKTKCVNEC